MVETEVTARSWCGLEAGACKERCPQGSGSCSYSFTYMLFVCFLRLYKIHYFLLSRASACQRHIEYNHHPIEIKWNISTKSRTIITRKQTYVHVVEALVDSFEVPGVSDEFVHPESSVHVV